MTTPSKSQAKRQAAQRGGVGRIGWWEEYKCGCVSGTTKFKKDLLGYCDQHGDNTRHVHPEYEVSDE